MDYTVSPSMVNNIPQKEKKRAIVQMRNKEQRRRSFSYLSKFVGKGDNKQLDKVLRTDENGVVVDTYQTKAEIE